MHLEICWKCDFGKSKADQNSHVSTLDIKPPNSLSPPNLIICKIKFRTDVQVEFRQTKHLNMEPNI